MSIFARSKKPDCPMRFVEIEESDPASDPERTTTQAGRASPFGTKHRPRASERSTRQTVRPICGLLDFAREKADNIFVKS